MCVSSQKKILTSLISHAPGAAPLLRGFNMSLINDADDIIYLLSPDFELIAYNQGWVNFALRNDGEKLLDDWQSGDSVLTAMPESLAEQTRARYRKVLAEQRPDSFEYECSSPEVRREFMEVVYPLSGGRGLLLTHSLVFAVREDAAVSPDLAPYRNTDGLLVQCSHCRRVSRQDGVRGWDWLPGLALSSAAGDISHTFCPYCLDHYYPSESGDLLSVP